MTCRLTTNISRTTVGNTIVDRSDVVVGAVPTTYCREPRVSRQKIPVAVILYSQFSNCTHIKIDIFFGIVLRSM